MKKNSQPVNVGRLGEGGSIRCEQNQSEAWAALNNMWETRDDDTHTSHHMLEVSVDGTFSPCAIAMAHKVGVDCKEFMRKVFGPPHDRLCPLWASPAQ